MEVNGNICKKVVTKGNLKKEWMYEYYDLFIRTKRGCLIKRWPLGQAWGFFISEKKKTGHSKCPEKQCIDNYGARTLELLANC